MTFSRALIVALYHAYVLVNIGLQYDIFTSTSLVGGFEFPAGILSVMSIHYLGRRATIWGASIGFACCTVVSAIVVGWWTKLRYEVHASFKHLKILQILRNISWPQPYSSYLGGALLSCHCLHPFKWRVRYFLRLLEHREWPSRVQLEWQFHFCLLS